MWRRTPDEGHSPSLLILLMLLPRPGSLGGKQTRAVATFLGRAEKTAGRGWHYSGIDMPKQEGRMGGIELGLGGGAGLLVGEDGEGTACSVNAHSSSRLSAPPGLSEVGSGARP